MNLESSILITTNRIPVRSTGPAVSPTPCAIRRRCKADEVIGVNSKNGDVCQPRGAAQPKRDPSRAPDEKTDRPSDRAARVHPVLSRPQARGRLQRFLLLQAAPRRLPRKWEGLGQPIQTQVLRFYFPPDIGSLPRSPNINQDVLALSHSTLRGFGCWTASAAR